MAKRSPNESGIRAAQELAAVLDASSEAIFVQDRSGCIRCWNAAAERIFGYDRHEILGKSANLLLENDSDRRFIEAQVLHHGQAVDARSTLRSKDGHLVNVAVTWAPVCDEAGHTREICAIAREQGRFVPDELAHALDLAPVIVRNLKGTILMWTKGMQMLYGFSAGEALGKNSHELFGTKFPGPLAEIENLVRRNGYWCGELRHKRKDGRQIWVASTWTMHRDASEVAILIEVNVDITGLKQAQEEIRRLNLELERRVEERTAALTETNRELEAFAYTISHDLRAPLRTMQGFGQALLEDYANRIDSTAAGYIARVANAASRMDALIQDLLAYSRLSRTDVRLEPVPLISVVRAAIEQLGAAGSGIEVRQPLFTVLGHSSVVVQVLMNLISNALKFHTPGVAPRIRIFSERRQGWVRLTVQDGGIGIEQRFHKKIFDVFQRLHGVEAFPGTGIGLSIVRKGIERLGGRYGLESEPGKGSRFWFELPEVTGDGTRKTHDSIGRG